MRHATANLPRETISKEDAVMSDRIDVQDAGPDAAAPRHDVEQTLAHVRDALRGLQYGEISIVVQDGVVIQIERLERTRFQRRRKA